MTVWREAQFGASCVTTVVKSRVLRAAQQLRAVQMRGAVAPDQPRMDLAAREPRAESEGEAVIDPTRRDLGEEQCEVERRLALLLQPDMGERGVLRDDAPP